MVPWPAVAGTRALDVGTFDGFWAFELERRGAREVVAIDIEDPRRIDWAYDHRVSGPAAIREWGAGRGPNFAEAAGALGSRVTWRDRSVYELNADQDGRFDVVVCGALLLHLRDPVLALERMRAVCSGHLVLVEAIDPMLELALPRAAVAHIRPEDDEWWRVNSAGLRKLVDTAGFEVTAVGSRFLVPHGEGAPRGHKLSMVGGLVTGQPGRRGLLTRAVVARPRPPRG